ncbi:uncharacterized protein LOC144638813 isoform X1 [Oculina patagonica]
MAEATIIENTFKMTTPEDYDKEAISAKRMKREAGSVTGKSVVVLKSSDVIKRDTIVFMPNTIEMAQLKKPERGQFKTNVQISSKMTESDIKKTLMETFPILRRQRFSCAAAVDNRSRLDFHGEPRIWDGPTVKRKIKGNSALYILTEELQQQQHGDQLDIRAPEQTTLKRSHDQIITNEQSKQSTSDMVPEKMQARLPIGFEKQAEFFAAHGNPLKHITSFPVVVPGQTQTVVQKNDNLPSTEKQSMQEGLDKLAAMQGFVLVTSQHMSPPVCRPSISTVHSIPSARDVVTMATSSLPTAFPMGAIMVPAGGIVVAQQGPIGNKAVSTVSDHQSLGNAVFHVAKGHDVRHTGLHIPPQVVVSSTLTPQMNSLNISNATSQQPQKPVIGEKSIAKRDQNIQTDDTELLQQDHPMTKLAQSRRSLPVENSYKTVSAPQDDFTFKYPDQTRLNSSQIMEKGACAHTASMAAAADKHQHRPAVSSDPESQSSDQTDSGIETTDITREDISQPKESYLDEAKRTQRQQQNLVKMNEAECSRTDVVGGSGLSLLTAAMEIREQKSIVAEICPNKSSLRGGNKFILILKEHLPSDVEFGYAYFGNSVPVLLNKVNEVNLTGTVPAYQVPGPVKVKVMSSTGSYLGDTSFTYIDDIEDVLRLLIHDRELQSTFFHLWAQGLGNETSESETKQRHSSQAPSNFNTGTTERPNLTKLLYLFVRLWSQEFKSGNLQPTESLTLETPGNQEKESDYDADDEASSDSSEDRDVPCSKDDCQNSKLPPSNGMKYTVEREKREIEGEWELLTSQHMEKQSDSQPTFQTFCNTGDICDQEQANREMRFFVFCDRLYNSPDSFISGNLDSLPFHGLESDARARIIELDSSGFPIKHEEEPTGLACDNCNDDLRDNSEAPERSNKTENADIIHKEELNCIDFDQNSVADKTRRAVERGDGETDDSPGDPL